jgi:prolipoprotein diacylglyceryl transferase
MESTSTDWNWGDPIPSPTQAYFDVFGLRVHYYAIFILVGIAVALWIANTRLVRRGGESGLVIDIALWAVPFGIIGGRLFHVLTHLSDYVGPNIDPLEFTKIWNGGLAIYGALIFGAVGAYIGAKRAKLSFLSLADVLAPGILLAQAIGRWGNYFNQELFGRPTDLPWALKIDRPNPAIPDGLPTDAVFHPTFFYEFLWSIVGVVILLVLDKRLNLRWGRLFGLYLIYYSIGRFWIENLRIDPSDVYLGLRTNQWSAVAGIVIGLALIIWSMRRHHGLELTVYTQEPEPKDEAGDVEDSEGETAPAAEAKSNQIESDETSSKK